MENSDIALVVGAIKQKNIEVVKLLLENGADPNTLYDNGCTLLSLGSCLGNFNIVELLLKYGADPNMQSNKGWAPLQIASSFDNINIIRLLLKYGADPNTQSNDGLSPLYNAILTCTVNFNTVKTLLEHGADPNKQYIDNYTPLICASINNLHDIIICLIDYGADYTLIDKYGKTAFDYASGDFIREYLETKEHQIILK